MDPRAFITLAHKLVAAPTSASCRTAIGRAYYALFNVGAEHLRSLGFSIGKEAAAHGEVQKFLINSGDAAVAAAGAELTALHSARNRADYQLDRTDVERAATAQTVVTLAESRIRSLDAAFAGPGRAQLQAAIQKWRRDNGYP